MVYLCDIHTVAEHVAEQGVNHLLVLRLQKVLHVRERFKAAGRHAKMRRILKWFFVMLLAISASVRPVVKPL
jgi:hypothetical protein